MIVVLIILLSITLFPQQIKYVPGEELSFEFNLETQINDTLIVNIDNFTTFYPEDLILVNQLDFIAKSFGEFEVGITEEFNGNAVIKGLALYGNSDSTSVEIVLKRENEVILIKNFLLFNEHEYNSKIFRISTIDKVFPNPVSSGSLLNANYISDYDTDLTLSVIDNAGKLLTQKSIEFVEAGVINISLKLEVNLSSGVYFIVIKDRYFINRKGFVILN
ncbi:T9SS type A sorting domain-containing protein [Candidatus Kapabacteria bacterium]|nr:T9SS type A sorting domain-containing protein [Candidatus Kapabacteria bacterium]